MTIIVQDLSNDEQSTRRSVIFMLLTIVGSWMWLRQDSENSRTLADLLSNVAGAAIAAGPAAVVIAPMAAAVAVATWVYGVYKESWASHFRPLVADQYRLPEHRPHIVRCLMGYIVDLTIIMQVVFRISLQNSHGTVDVARVEQEMEIFMNSRTKETIHADIRTFVQGINPFGRDSIVHKIELLIHFNSTISTWMHKAQCGRELSEKMIQITV
jgi:hypothetical protein